MCILFIKGYILIYILHSVERCMLYCMLVLIVLFASFITTFLIFPEEKDLVKRVVETVNIFCLGYLLFSLPFLVLENFSVWKPLVLLTGILIVIICIYRERIHIITMKIAKDEIKVLIFLLCCLPLLWKTSEDVSANTDQGGYFIHTVILIEEKSKEAHYSFDHKNVSDKQILEDLEALQTYNAGFYRDEKGDYYVFSLNTWCAFAALFGKMFGLFNSMKIGIIFYILAVLNMYYACKKLSNNTYAKYLSLFLFGLSPIILYIAKSGLTECTSMFFFIMGMRYVMEKRRSGYILGGIALGYLGFLHVSAFIYLPIICLFIVLLRSYYDDNNIGLCNIIQSGMYAVSLWYAYRISPVYIEKQFKRFTLDGRISFGMLFLSIDFVLLLFIVLQSPLFYTRSKYLFDLIREFIEKYFRIIIIAMLIVIIIRTIYFGYSLGFTENFAIPEGYDAGSWNLRSRYVNTGFTALSYLNIVNIARATGIIGFIIFMLAIFIKIDTKTEIAKYLYLMGLYGIFYWTVLQVDTPFNYYASRYFVPFVIPVISLFLASSIKNKNFILYIIMVSCMFYNHFHYAFLQGAPKLGQYQVLQETMEIIPQDSLVFCNPESTSVNTLLTNTLRIINDCSVYNLKSIEKVAEVDNTMKYIISETELGDEFELLFQKVYDIQYSFGNGKNGNYDTYVGTYEFPLYIYRLEGGV